MNLPRTRTRESARAWAGMRRDFAAISDWHEGNIKSYETAPGSLLHLADAMSEPHQASHVVGYLLLTAVDHLHALRMVIVDAGSQHIFAPYTLIRGAIENASTALWVLQQDEPRSIAVRALTLEYRGLLDQIRAARAVDHTAEIDKDLQDIFTACLDRHGFTQKEVKTALQHLPLIDEISTHFHVRNAALTWQFCSAAAHGRQWAWRYLTVFQAQDDDGVSKVLNGQLTSNETIIAYSLNTACNVVRKALTVRKLHSRDASHTGTSLVKSESALDVVRAGLYLPGRPHERPFLAHRWPGRKYPPGAAHRQRRFRYIVAV